MEGPDFICIGAQKAGTGWLYDQLRTHPDFWMPPLKELHYFDRAGRAAREVRSGSVDRIEEARRTARDDRDVRFLEAMQDLREQPALDLPRYGKAFAARGSLLSGDITPGYSTLDGDLVRQIAECFSSAKIIFFARDPVERAWSQLSMWVRHGVLAKSEIDPSHLDEILRRPAILSRSFPSEIVRRWRKWIAPDLLRVFFFDDIQRDAAAVRASVIEFLGGDAARPSAGLKPTHNAKAQKEKLALTDEVRAALAAFFREELRVCASELGGPAVDWPRRYGS